jgi:F-type H+-transporting ATPase subunit epsilon
MAKSFRLEVITPERLFYEGDVEMVIVRTLIGYEGFLANHSWACKLLDTGVLKIKENGAKEFKIAAITGGFIDVKDRIIIFTDAAEWPEEIDIERQKRKIEEMEARLKGMGDDANQLQAAKVSIAKAANRINVLTGKGIRR